MIDNLYFLFLDEIYAPNLNDMLRFSKKDIFTRVNHLHFGIAGVLVPGSRLQDLVLKSAGIKRRYYPHLQTLIFHYVEILNDKGIFSDLLKNHQKKQGFTSSLSSFVKNFVFKYDCVFIDKHELIKKHGIFDSSGRIVRIRKIGSNLFPKSPVLDYNLYLLCLRKMLENFFVFLSDRKRPARGVVVAEARGEREDTELRMAFNKIYYQGISSIKPRDLRGVILDLFIVPKKQDYVGTQLADLVLYPTYDGAVPFHNKRNDHFISYSGFLKDKLLSKGGVTIIP